MTGMKVELFLPLVLLLSVVLLFLDPEGSLSTTMVVLLVVLVVTVFEKCLRLC